MSIIKCYHTTENRNNIILSNPTLSSNAWNWLGKGYYFWEEVDDAINWGVKSKNNKYQIYSADIDYKNVLNTAWNREHYKLFTDSIELFYKKLGITHEEVEHEIIINKVIEYLTKSEIKGITYLNTSPSTKFVIKMSGRSTDLFYRSLKKCVQVCVYDMSILCNFKFHKKN